MKKRGAVRERRSTVVVYRRVGGDIVHVHECVTERGGAHPAPAALGKTALTLALQNDQGRRLSARDVAVLHVPPRSLEGAGEDVGLRVDVKGRRLVKVALKRRMRPVVASPATPGV
jgi:hypothetical protein